MGNGYVALTPPSFMTLLLRVTAPNLADVDAPPLQLGSATGFLTRTPSGRLVLVTARHVVSGRHTETDQPLGRGATPHHLVVRLPHTSKWDAYWWVQIPLRSEDGAPLWLGHPDGFKIDLAAVPVPDELGFCSPEGVSQGGSKFEGVVRSELVWHPLSTRLGPISLDVADELHVVGYPLGITGARDLAVWVRGFIATEMQFDYSDRPMFLLDARTREGHSGAPVVFFSRSGTFPTGSGMGSGIGSNLLRFIGVYSGRVTDEVDLGRVFKASAVHELLSHGLAPLQ